MSNGTKIFLADAIVVSHLFYVGFVVAGPVFTLLGAWLRWAWVRRRGLRLTHLICTCIVPLEALSGIICPLTEWERDLRWSAGQTPEEISFMGRLARDMLFFEAPVWVFTACYVVFGLLVVALWFLVPPAKKKKRATV